MPLPHSPVSRSPTLHDHEGPASRVARVRRVKIHSLLAIACLQRLDLIDPLQRRHDIHQAGGRTLHQLYPVHTIHDEMEAVGIAIPR